MMFEWQKMQGTYRLSIGTETYEYKNVITDNGRLALLQAISGQKQGWATSIVAGIGNTVATASDDRLNYLVTGGDISTTIIDPVNEKLYFKTSLPLQDELTIYELGCYSSNTLSTQSSESGGGGILALFTTDNEWVDLDGTSQPDTDNNRIGKDSISYDLTASDTASGYLSYIADLLFIPTNATFKLAYYTTGITDLVISFRVDDSNYFSYDGLAVGNGYHVDSVLKSGLVATGTPSWSDIQSIQFDVTAGGSGGSVSLDALRYELPIIEESNLLSRVVLGTPIAKLPGVPLDIEYVLEV